ncbi:MAG: hypothetical protein IJY09_08605 [Lachnospiraceae bacterium]|nr:hypothetical protein [Lachnospiraceae bacterium]
MQLEITQYLEQREYDALLSMQTAWEYLGYRGNAPEPEMQEELEECWTKLKEVMCPAFSAELAELTEQTAECTKLSWGGTKLSLPGRSLAAHLEHCSYAVCAALTLGEAVDELIEALQEESMLKALLTDALANAAVEGVRMYLEQSVEQALPQMRKNWLFGIGYGDLPIELQPVFLERLHTEERIGLRCNAKGVLLPMKSVTGFLGLTYAMAEQPLTENRGANCGRQDCAQCTNMDCGKRRLLKKK